MKDPPRLLASQLLQAGRTIKEGDIMTKLAAIIASKEECGCMEGCLHERRYAAAKAQYYSECHNLLMGIANQMPYATVTEIRDIVKSFLYSE